MPISLSEIRARAKWEFLNNPHWVTVKDPELDGFETMFESILLIAPTEYANILLNKRMRKLAIKQGVFKPSPKTEEERKRLNVSLNY
jgi:hypothetical protein